jgi:hypothetical protein
MYRLCSRTYVLSAPVRINWWGEGGGRMETLFVTKFARVRLHRGASRPTCYCTSILLLLQYILSRSSAPLYCQIFPLHCPKTHEQFPSRFGNAEVISSDRRKLFMSKDASFLHTTILTMCTAKNNFKFRS